MPLLPPCSSTPKKKEASLLLILVAIKSGVAYWCLLSKHETSQNNKTHPKPPQTTKK